MDSQLKTYLVAGGALLASYAILNYYFKEKVKSLSLDLTRKISQEIKHQMLIACVNFSEGIKTHVNSKIGAAEDKEKKRIMESLLDEIAKIYKSKEDLILNKYIVLAESYQAALKDHGNDNYVKNNVEQILDMMRKAAAGETPDLTVPKKAFDSFKREELRKIYKQMCIKIATLVVKKLVQKMESDPYFDCANDAHFRQAIRELSVYDIKVGFLKTKGFKQQWGCPNEIFFKIIEAHKLASPEYKAEMVLIEKAYEKIIQISSVDPKSINLEKIQEFFMQSIDSKKNVSKSMLNPSIEKSFSVDKDKSQQGSVKDSFLKNLQEKPLKKEEPKEEDYGMIDPFLKNVPQTKPLLTQKKEEELKEVDYGIEDPFLNQPRQPIMKQPQLSEPLVLKKEDEQQNILTSFRSEEENVENKQEPKVEKKQEEIPASEPEQKQDPKQSEQKQEPKISEEEKPIAISESYQNVEEEKQVKEEVQNIEEVVEDKKENVEDKKENAQQQEHQESKEELQLDNE